MRYSCWDQLNEFIWWIIQLFIRKWDWNQIKCDKYEIEHSIGISTKAHPNQFGVISITQPTFFSHPWARMCSSNPRLCYFIELGWQFFSVSAAQNGMWTRAKGLVVMFRVGRNKQQKKTCQKVLMTFAKLCLLPPRLYRYSNCTPNGCRQVNRNVLFNEKNRK